MLIMYLSGHWTSKLSQTECIKEKTRGANVAARYNKKSMQHHVLYCVKAQFNMKMDSHCNHPDNNCVEALKEGEVSILELDKHKTLHMQLPNKVCCVTSQTRCSSSDCC